MKAANYDLRIIPARAGFTDVPFFQANQYKDHPRSRGVYCRQAVQGLGDAGSSPLARGLLNAADQVKEGDRIIPARAGFTEHQQRRQRDPEDHPRSRGVYTWRSLESQRSLTLPDGFRLHC